MRRLVLAVATVVSLAGAAPAVAVGPWLWTVNGGPGITRPGGDVRYVARLGGGSTVVLERRAGHTARSLLIAGRWGLQAATTAGEVTGLSGDGRRLVLTGPTRMEPVATSSFVVVDTRSLARPRTIHVPGDMTVDALAPDGRLLYLIQHVRTAGNDRYQVRAFDLRRERLLERVIADKRQQGWLMTGMPVARAEASRGEMVYTLYQSGSNYPFVHVLDTAHATAVCIGLPLDWSDPGVLDGVTLRLEDGGARLVVEGPGTGGPVTIDTRTARVLPRQP